MDLGALGVDLDALDMDLGTLGVGLGALGMDLECSGNGSDVGALSGQWGRGALSEGRVARRPSQHAGTPTHGPLGNQERRA